MVDPITHIKDIQKVLKQLLKFEFFVKFEKYIFNILEISLLGFILIIEEVKIDPTCVFTIKEWQLPSSFPEIQVFLGFANFYCQFIKKFLRIIESLMEMLKGSIQGKF